MRSAAMVSAASVLVVSLSACGGALSGGDSGSSATVRKGNDVKIGLLLPEKGTARYEKFDYPIIKKQVSELTKGEGELVYANAGNDADLQSRQLEKMIDDKVDTLIVDPVDAKLIGDSVQKAKDAGIHVIAYDRLAEGPVDAYVGFDGEAVGQTQARELLYALGGEPAKTTKIVMINGSPTDPNAAIFKKGASSALTSVTIAKSYDTEAWKPETAKAHMEEAIAEIGAANIAGVYSANDGMAGGIVEALKEAGVTELPPITGQDAELAAIRRILTGDQYMTVYKPYGDQAAIAAEMAVRVAQGRNIEFESLAMREIDSPTTKKIRMASVTVYGVTRKDIKETVLEDGFFKVSEICTPKYEEACAEAGLK
ncbi:sugar ABC transporter substrate-binding protein [Streptomyces apocyni]|uniref:sugar ABC transporter substrate-binding protein n=1 Tax=Streptomyces apocyni TaxID=2654677 RepID=UPI001E4B1E52|nr:substrate-binding domain-containing protein [Streptomyces apocyni]